MIRNLTLLGIVLVILGGALTALSEPDAAAVTTDQQEQADRSPTPEPEAEAMSTPKPVTNREDCGKIRGTQYLSREERTWFLANCVRQ